MYSLSTLRNLNEKASQRARRENRRPTLYTGGHDEVRQFPYLGSAGLSDDAFQIVHGSGFGPIYKAPEDVGGTPPGFVCTRLLFVDTSGFGADDEPALTQSQFMDTIIPGLYYAVVEIGEFQAYVAEYCLTKDSLQ